MEADKEVARAVAMNALASFAGREKKRDVLSDGSRHAVSLKVTGTVDGSRVSIPINGDLVIGETNPTGSSKSPCMNTLLAHALDMMPKTRRKAFFESLGPRKKSLPDVSNETLVEIKSLKSRLTTKSPRAGSVKFEGS